MYFERLEPQKAPLWSNIKVYKKSIILVLTPILLLPLLFSFPNNVLEARCAYCVLIMEVFWVMEILPLAITALLPLVMFPVMGIMPSEKVSRVYLSDTSFLFIGGLMVACAVEKSKLHKRIALFVLSIVGSQPQWIMFGFMAVTGFLSMWISNTATTALMVPIVQSVIVELVKNHRGQYELVSMSEHSSANNPDALPPTGRRRSLSVDQQRRLSLASNKHREIHEILSSEELRMAKGLLISVCTSANVGGMGTITGTASNLILIGQIVKLYPGADTGINFFSWMVFAVPMVVLTLVLCWIVLVVLFLRNTPKGSDIVTRKLKSNYNNLPPITFSEWAVIGVFFCLLSLWILRDPQVVTGFGEYFKHGYVTDATSAILICVLLFALPDDTPDFMRKRYDKHRKMKVRSSLLDWKTVQAKFPWSVVLLLGGGFAMAAGVRESHLSYRIGEVMSNLHVFPSLVIMMICIGITILLTNVCSNTVTASIFIPIVAELASSLSIHPLYFMLPTALACSLAFTLPVATPPNAIVFASGMITVKDMVSAGLIISVISASVTILNMMLWGHFLFSLDQFPSWATPPVVEEIAISNSTLIHYFNATNPGY
ncbi:hypothetical protein L596_003506 [Steinernema carpocapsae]|uniref:Citrate transporter-like domain-containing protein n=1 Tax=Steinernema carpocapsae TaxID=34508 RepID=A0A4U8USQ4_STECR|nr:hypothetical protein L596_003506 [Steinernema carpocapsae]